MDGNILAMLLQSLGGGQAPGRAAPWAQPWLDDGAVTGPNTAPVAAPVIEKPADPGPDFAGHLNAVSAGMAPNILQQLGTSPEAAPAPKIADEPTEAPRARRSFLETLGRVADAFAAFGGQERGYQGTLDAQDARKQASITQGMQRTLAEQQIATGADTAAGRDRARFGQAIRGVQAVQAGGGDINTAWPVIAQQMGIAPDQAAQYAQLFATNPGAVVGLANALNEPGEFATAPTIGRDAQGNLHIYQLDRHGGAREVNLGTGIMPAEPVQMVNTGDAQVGVGRNSHTAQVILPVHEAPGRAADRNQRGAIAHENNATSRANTEVRARTAREINAARVAAQRDATNARYTQTLTPTQRGAVAQTREALPAIERTLSRVDQLSRQLGGTSGPIGGRVPGQLAGGASAQFDRAQALLAAQIRTLLRTTGEGSMSDYESRLNVATLPARTDSIAGRQEAIRNLRGLLTEIRARSNRLLAPPSSNAPAPAPARRSAAPAGRGGWGTATVVGQ